MIKSKNTLKNIETKFPPRGSQYLMHAISKKVLARIKNYHITMRSVVRLVSVLLLTGGFAGAECVQAQTEKALQQGQTAPIPYISHAEFQDISLGGETGSSTSSSPQTTFSDILTVTSLEEVTRHFGEPSSTEYDRFPEGSPTDYVVTLDYDGINLEYRKGGGEIKLQTMVITSKDRFLKVGGVRLQPGMSTDSLSAVMRKTVRDDGEGFLRVAPPGKSEDPRSIRDSETTIQFWVEKDGKDSIVKKVRFHRIAP